MGFPVCRRPKGRDLKTRLSRAVQDSLIQYQQAFKQSHVIQEN
jgi:hypothetical protein